MKHRSWILFSGALWFIMGSFLLYKGLFYLAEGAALHSSASWFLMAGLAIGFVKGQFVLAKTAKRLTGKIYSLPLPIRLHEVYPKGYWLLIGSMVGLGMIMRFLPIPVDFRGFIDVAIGTALVRGSFFYFRALRKRARI